MDSALNLAFSSNTERTFWLRFLVEMVTNHRVGRKKKSGASSPLSRPLNWQFFSQISPPREVRFLQQSSPTRGLRFQSQGGGEGRWHPLQPPQHASVGARSSPSCGPRFHQQKGGEFLQQLGALMMHAATYFRLHFRFLEQALVGKVFPQHTVPHARSFPFMEQTCMGKGNTRRTVALWLRFQQIMATQVRHFPQQISGAWLRIALLSAAHLGPFSPQSTVPNGSISLELIAPKAVKNGLCFSSPTVPNLWRFPAIRKKQEKWHFPALMKMQESATRKKEDGQHCCPGISLQQAALKGDLTSSQTRPSALCYARRVQASYRVKSSKKKGQQSSPSQWRFPSSVVSPTVESKHVSFTFSFAEGHQPNMKKDRHEEKPALWLHQLRRRQQHRKVLFKGLHTGCRFRSQYNEEGHANRPFSSGTSSQDLHRSKRSKRSITCSST